MLHLILPAVRIDRANNKKHEKCAWQKNSDGMQKSNLKIKWYVKQVAILAKTKHDECRKDFEKAKEKEKTVFENIWRKNWQDVQN